ncbi:MAG: glycosyltransferase family 4 protein [Planctomycetes bacterium]|nr:glycosyltransferase family 4 protein [Planctomycetota bacterium]
MKILILSGMLEYRGVGLYTLYLAEELKKRGHNLQVVTAGGKLVDEFKSRKIQVKEYPSLLKTVDGLFFCAELVKELNSNYPDIIHMHFSHNRLAGLAGSLSQRMKRPYLVTVPNIQLLTRKLKINKKWIKNIITTTESAREHLVNDLKTPKELIEVIYAGIDSSRIKSVEVPKEKNGKRIIGIIGPLEKWRGHQYFLEAGKWLVENNYDVQFLIIGEGSLEDELRRMVVKMGLQKKAVFIPSMDSYYRVLPMVDIFVFPIRRMGVGITLLEAMALEKPVIVSGISDIYTLVKDGETGYYIPPDNADAIKEKIIHIFNNQEEALRIGQQARIFIKDNFTSQKMADQTIELYEKALEKVSV